MDKKKNSLAFAVKLALAVNVSAAAIAVPALAGAEEAMI